VSEDQVAHTVAYCSVNFVIYLVSVSPSTKVAAIFYC